MTGALAATLDAAVSDGAVAFTFQVTNEGPEAVTATFRSGLSADVAVSEGGEEVWRWSDGRLFTQAIERVTFAPGETRTYEATWPDPDPGTYRAVATLEADVAARAAATVEV